MAARSRAGDGGDGGELEKAIGSVSRNITDPVAKLRYIRRSLADYQSADQRLRAVPSPWLRRLLYRGLSIIGLRHALDTRSFGYSARADSSGRLLILSRISVAAAALLVAVGLVSVAYKASRPAATSAGIAGATSGTDEGTEASTGRAFRPRPRPCRPPGSGKWRRATATSCTATACASRPASR